MTLGDAGAVEADRPFREWRLPLNYFFPRRVPDQLMRFACPEFGRPVDRLAIHPPILIETFDPRFFRKIFRRFENALLDQMRLNIVVHEQSLICARNR